MEAAEKKALTEALRWHIDAGAYTLLDTEPVDKTQDVTAPGIATPRTPAAVDTAPVEAGGAAVPNTGHTLLLGTAEAVIKAKELAAGARSRDELCDALQGFDGLTIKKSATNLVFADGNPAARIMLIGEAPGADEDRQGKPFVGTSGQLLDKVLATIGLDRHSSRPEESVYITNILNWRPPGNRTPSDGEIEVSLPFVEKHITLINPDILVLCGATAARGLLGDRRNISKLRGQWHTYRPRSLDGDSAAGKDIPALVVYHPAYLLRNPVQKRAMWHDMLRLRQKRDEG